MQFKSIVDLLTVGLRRPVAMSKIVPLTVANGTFRKFLFSIQVILKKTLERRQANDIVSKIALQINAKLGGELWACKSVYVSWLGLAYLCACVAPALTFGASHLRILTFIVPNCYRSLILKMHLY